MRCLVVTGLLLCFAAFGSAGVSKCTPSSLNPECLKIAVRNSNQKVIEEAECLVGSEWESNCHLCQCTEEGIAKCIKMKTCDKQYEGLEPIHCKPNTTFSRDCNECLCLDSGLGLCTLKSCKKVTITNRTPQFNTCAPGSKWKSRCNQCFCTPDGAPACTDMACQGYENEPERECAPESTWDGECNNLCWCVDGKAACTRMGCINASNIELHFDDEPIVEPVSKIGGTKQENPATIVRKTRALPSQEPAKNCQPGQEFRLDCNTCLCDNRGIDYSCTRLDCQANSNIGTSSLRRRKREVTQQAVTHCDPGAVFEQDCNVCRCTSDGRHATCTLKLCSLKPLDDKNVDESNQPKVDPNFRCNPGEQFKRDCNDCTCSADGRSIFCTLYLCDKDVVPRI